MLDNDKHLKRRSRKCGPENSADSSGRYAIFIYEQVFDQRGRVGETECLRKRAQPFQVEEYNSGAPTPNGQFHIGQWGQPQLEFHAFFYPVSTQYHIL